MAAGASSTNRSVLIRPFEGADAGHAFEAIQESLADVAVWMPDLATVSSREEVAIWIATHPEAQLRGTEYHFAIVDAGDGGFLGGCGLTHLHRRHRFANLYYWVRSSRMRQGVATTATQLLAKWGFAELGLNRIEIVVGTGNAASLRVAEKAGALREGTLRNRLVLPDRVHDAVMFSLIPRDLDHGV